MALAGLIWNKRADLSRRGDVSDASGSPGHWGHTLALISCEGGVWMSFGDTQKVVMTVRRSSAENLSYESLLGPQEFQSQELLPQ